MTTVTPIRRNICLIGVPTDVNSSFLRGPAKAPAAIRAALGSDHTTGSAEIGDVYGTDARLLDMIDLPLQEIDSDFDQIEAAVAEAMSRGEMPFCIGGDHSIAFPSVRAVAKLHGPVNILHFDAHLDIFDDYEGNPRSHASPFARIMESGVAKRLVQVGIRTLNGHQQDQVNRFGVEPILMTNFAPDRVPVLDGPLYISVDLDGFDPSVAPGVSHYEPGGLTVREVLAVLLRQTAPIVGADLVEYNPDRDINGMTAAVCAKMIREISALAARNVPADSVQS